MSRSMKAHAIAAISALLDKTRSEGGVLPNDGVSLRLGEILVLSELTTNHLHRYVEVRNLLASYAEEIGVAYSRQGRVQELGAPEPPAGDLVPAKRLREAQRRLATSERRCAELRAELARMRSKQRTHDEVAELIKLGGRINRLPTDRSG